MKLTPRQLGWLMVGAIATAIVSVMVLSRSGEHRTASTVAGSSPASTQRSTTHSTPATTKSNSPTSVIHPKKVTKQNLDKRAVAFLTLYYLIRPTDSVADRAARIAPFMTRDVLDRIDLGFSSGTEADRARIRNRLTIRGKALLKQLVKTRPTDQGGAITVSVPVVITITRPGDKLVNRFQRTASTTWTQDNGKWYLSDFSEGGDIGE